MEKWPFCIISEKESKVRYLFRTHPKVILSFYLHTSIKSSLSRINCYDENNVFVILKISWKLQRYLVEILSEVGAQTFTQGFILSKTWLAWGVELVLELQLGFR